MLTDRVADGSTSTRFVAVTLLSRVTKSLAPVRGGTGDNTVPVSLGLGSGDQ